MGSLKNKGILISGASIAGLSSAYWMDRLGYHVTVVETAKELRTGGAAVNVNKAAIEIVSRMGILEQLRFNGLKLEKWEFKNAGDETVGTMGPGGQEQDDEIEIERKQLIRTLFDTIKDKVEFIFDDSIISLSECADGMDVAFKNGRQRKFDMVLGCDGLHSAIRKIWFGHEQEYVHFLQHYFSLTIVNRSLIRQNTAQMYNEPGRVIMLNAYNGKTDIVFCFSSEKEIPYNYRDTGQQAKIVSDRFGGQGWRTKELLEIVSHTKTAYFDKFCQVKMPHWTKGKVALVGDAGYCASPAAGVGASLAIIGAATLADALEKHKGDFEMAFRDHNTNLKPLIEETQDMATMILKEYLIPQTEEAIAKRNSQKSFF